MSNKPATKNQRSVFEGTNWLEQYSSPFGRSTEAEFGRGWMMVVIGQVVVSVICILLLFSENSANSGFYGLFAALFIGTWAVGILHIRRLHDGGRSGWVSFFVYLPIVLAIGSALAPQPSPQDMKIQQEAAAISADITSVKTSTKKEKTKPLKRKDGFNFRIEAGKGKKMTLSQAGKKGVSLVSTFAIFAMLSTLLSLLLIHQLKQEPRSNQWGDPSGGRFFKSENN